MGALRAGVALTVALAGVFAAGGSETSAATAPPAPCPSQQAHPWCNRSLSPDARAALFQNAMTEDEEITLVAGNGTGATPHTGATYAIPRLGLRAVYLTDGRWAPDRAPQPRCRSRWRSPPPGARRWPTRTVRTWAPRRATRATTSYSARPSTSCARRREVVRTRPTA